MYTPELGSFFEKALRRCRGGAASRGIEFAIHVNDVLGLYLKNHGRCEATGVLLSLRQGGKGRKNWLIPSVDRIDNDRGYYPDNIQVVAAIVNIMKNDLSMDGFVTWCQRVANYRELQMAKLSDELDGMAVE